MYLIGDVHGNLFDYLDLCYDGYRGPGKMLQGGLDCSIQVGDMGIFDEEDADDIPQSDKHLFIRGNHDNPELCRQHPNYLGDYGYRSDLDLFYIGGGFSIDKAVRTIGIDWWEDEELSYDELDQAIQLFSKHKPKIMISHECPTSIKDVAVTNGFKINYSSRTEMALQSMFENHQPELWVFGHHHQRIEKEIDGTHFVCLHAVRMGSIKDCVYEVPGLTW